jgi:hypothetical protein
MMKGQCVNEVFILYKVVTPLEDYKPTFVT